MKRIYLLFLLPLFFGYVSCGKLNPDEVKEIIMEGERERIPLLVQQLPLVESITVDSIRLVVEDVPMSGYLYTTWSAENQAIPIIVPLDNIHKSKEHRGYVEWNSDWETAAKGFLIQGLMSHKEAKEAF